jgi:hypothetical protein
MVRVLMASGRKLTARHQPHHPPAKSEEIPVGE